MATQEHRGVRSRIGALAFWTCAIFSLTLIGCWAFTTYAFGDKKYDVTDEYAGNGKYSRGAELVVQHDAVIYRRGGSAKPPLNPTVEELRNAPSKWEHLTIMPQGTKVRVAKVMRYQTMSHHNDVLFGVWMDGPFAGQETNIGGMDLADAGGDAGEQFHPH
ncbi:MAG TPA: hypothetical protein VHM90_16925 [Phycisphaerae bacterium]|jgi:hypothetical protein|nr:hypothetical protein [Phycisphaerae bacterium]